METISLKELREKIDAIDYQVSLAREQQSKAISRLEDIQKTRGDLTLETIQKARQIKGLIDNSESDVESLLKERMALQERYEAALRVEEADGALQAYKQTEVAFFASVKEITEGFRKTFKRIATLNKQVESLHDPTALFVNLIHQLSAIPVSYEKLFLDRQIVLDARGNETFLVSQAEKYRELEHEVGELLRELNGDVAKAIGATAFHDRPYGAANRMRLFTKKNTKYVPPPPPRQESNSTTVYFRPNPKNLDGSRWRGMQRKAAAPMTAPSAGETASHVKKEILKSLQS